MTTTTIGSIDSTCDLMELKRINSRNRRHRRAEQLLGVTISFGETNGQSHSQPTPSPEFTLIA